MKWSKYIGGYYFEQLHEHGGIITDYKYVCFNNSYDFIIMKGVIIMKAS